jgi:hypothetical protein
MITGEKFIGIADFVFAPKTRGEDDYNGLVNTLKIDNLKEENVVYTHTMYARELFDTIRSIPSLFTVITHNSDINIDDSFKLPENVSKWYSQNVNVVDKRIESIPIGLENERWFPGLHKKEKMNFLLTKPKGCRNWLYMNHNIKTNPKARQGVYDLLKDEVWVTAENGKNGYDFNRYLENIYNHRYVICPQGNGMDTHRFWECLYMGTVPIVKKDINNSFYSDMRVLYVNNWEEITEELLAERWNDFKEDKWNKEKLTFDYWKKWITTQHIN